MRRPSSGLNPQSNRLNSVKPWNVWLTVALSSAIIVGILLAWTPQFWAVAVLHTIVLVTAGTWLFLCPDPKMPSVLCSVLVSAISVWGWVQLACFGSSSHSSTRTVAMQWTVAGIAFYLSTQTLQRKEVRNIFLSIIVWASAVFSILALLQMYSSPNQVLWFFPAQQFSVGTFLYKNQFVAMIELAMPIALYWILFKKGARPAGIFTGLSLFAGAIASGSRAGASLVLLECLVAALLAYRDKKLNLLSLLITVPAVAIVLASTAYLAGNDSVWTHFQEVHPDAARQELLKSTVQMFAKEPWSGYGLGAWPVIYPQYAAFDIGRVANAAHNDWAEWAAEGGIVFVGSIFALCLIAIRPAIKSIWGLGVIAIMLHSWVDYPTREPVICILWFCMMGGLLASKARYSKPRSSKDSDSSQSNLAASPDG